MCLFRICRLSIQTIIVLGILKLIFTFFLIVTAIVGLVMIQFVEIMDKYNKELYGIFSSVISLALIYFIILSIALFGVKDSRDRFILPYIIYSFFYITAYIIIIGYATSILFTILELYQLSLLAVFTLEGTGFVIGLCFQIYFALVVYNRYVRVKTMRNQQSKVEEPGDNFARQNNQDAVPLNSTVPGTVQEQEQEE